MTREEIQKFIDEDINPGLGMHGGYLLVQNFDTDTKVLTVEMGGGCQGCASASITLKLMVDNALKDRFPDLAEIRDSTDHYAGVNPYYG